MVSVAGSATDSAVASGFVVDATYAYWTEDTGTGSDFPFMPLTGGQAGEISPNEAEGLTSLTAANTGVFYAVTNPSSLGGNNVGELLAGSSSFQTAASTGTDSAGAITADSISVYWIDITTSALMKAPRAGGTATSLVPGLGYTGGGLAADSTSVYFADSGAIKKVASGGGGVTTLAPTQGNAVFVAVEASYVYWTQGSSLIKVPVGGGSLATVTSGQTFSYVAIDATSFYWSTGAKIEKVALAGGTPTTLTTFASGAKTYGVGVSGNSVYWLDNTANSISGTLMKLTPK